MKNLPKVREYHSPVWNEPIIMEMGRKGERGILIPETEDAIIEKVGDACDTAPIGSGPYKFLEQKENSYIKYEALDSHWRTGIIIGR